MTQKTTHVLRVPVTLWSQLDTHVTRRSLQSTPNFALQILTDYVQGGTNQSQTVTNTHQKSAPSAAPGHFQPILEEETQKKGVYKKIYSITDNRFIREDIDPTSYESAHAYFCVFVKNLEQEKSRGDEWTKLKQAYEWLHIDVDAPEDTEHVLKGIKWAERYMR